MNDEWHGSQNNGGKEIKDEWMMNDINANEMSWGGEGMREVEEKNEWMINDREANEDERGGVENEK